jgi:hypothetical protein
MEFLAPILQRNVIITLAIIGGVVATLGNFLVQKKPNSIPRTSRLILKSGYTITWTSIALFIAAGFFGE